MRLAWVSLMFVGAAAAQDPVIDEAAIAAEVAKLPLVEVERPWKEHAYPGFVESIDVLVGAGAHDCGYYDTHDRRQTPALHADVRRCVEDAMASGNPFKFGYEGLSVDALEWQVIARAPSAELWVVQIFRSIGNGDGRLQQINKVCASVKFFADIRTINHGCVEKSRGPLPAR